VKRMEYFAKVGELIWIKYSEVPTSRVRIRDLDGGMTHSHS
jgi:hypothetical protein